MNYKSMLAVCLIAIFTILLLGGCKKETSKSTLKTFSGTIYNAHDPAYTSNPNCFIDLNTGSVYSISQAKSHATEVDAYWVTTWITSSSDQPVFTSTDNYSGLTGGRPYYTETTLFGGWSTRNQTLFSTYNLSDLKIPFDNINTTDDLNKAVAEFSTPYLQGINSSFRGTQSDLDDVSYFETNTNGVKKRGLIKFTRASYSSNHSALNSADFVIKVIP